MPAFSDIFFQSSRLTNAAFHFGKAVHSMGLINMMPPPLEVKEYKLISARWPSHYKPLKIAMAADFHVGCLAVGLDDVRNYVERINALEADIILLPGDFLNSPYGHDGVYVEPKEIAAAFEGLHAPCGVHAVLDNHDIYEDPRICDSLRNVGINVLVNNSVIVHGTGQEFRLVGVHYETMEDNHSHCKRAFSTAKDNLPIIAMCHNPVSIHGMPEGLVAAVAGHTHAQQFKIPGVKNMILDCHDKGLDYGYVERRGNPLIVTSGLGTSVMPFRNVAPEIVEITINAAVPELS